MLLERDGYPPGVPSWVDTAQPDPEAAVRFYGGLFGWEFEYRMPADSPGRYFVAQLQGRDVAAVGSQPEDWPPAAVWNTYVWVDSADATATRVKDAGGMVLMDPFDVLDAGRTGVFADPEGAVFCLWQADQHRGAELVNHPNTWNWSDLSTRDPAGAAAFYGAVFGWEADTAALEAMGFTFWRLPGYGDFLEVRDPDLRRRQADAGAPPGFEDAVASLVLLGGDQSGDVAPHWSVTFAVDATDATVDRAVELGGRVVVPPFDAPPVRSAVLADPQGATFAVNTYTPASESA
ncbi:MAG: VOC family protein [Acidimicrobiales bacterium]